MPRITLFFDCSQGVDEINRTISSLAKQNTQTFEAVFICNSKDVEAASLATANNSRFHVESDNISPAEIIESYAADGYMFCTCGAVYTRRSIEKMFGALITRSADIVVGRGDIRLFDCNERSITVYGERDSLDIERKQSFNLLESKSFGNLTATKGMIDYVPTDNKVYSRRVVLECIADMPDFSMLSRWLFHLKAMLSARSAYGVNAQGCRVHFLLADKTPLKTRDDYSRFKQAFENAANAIKSADFITYSDAAYQSEEDAAFRREYLCRWLRCYKLCALIGLWSHWYWKMDEQARLQVEDEMRTFSEHVPEQWVDQYFENRSDLFAHFTDMREGRPLVIEPIVSLILLPGMPKEIADSHRAEFERQESPYVELLIPSSEKYASQYAEDSRRIHTIEYRGEDIGQWLTNVVAHAAGGKYIVFLEDKIYWTGSSITRAMYQLDHSSYDCLLVRPASKKEGSLRVFELALPSVAEYKLKEPINDLDNSLNNKMFRAGALRKKGFVFSGKHVEDALRVHSELVCLAYPDIKLLCKDGNSTFLSRVPQAIRLKYKIAYRKLDKDREKLGPIKTAFTENSTSGVSNQILFTTNRAKDALSPHLQAVYDALPGDKVILCNPTPHTVDYSERLIREMSKSRIIITDDYIHELKYVKLASNQRLYQIWHAYGAFKKFGLDCFGMPADTERACHSQYTNVFVSAEGIRDIYAGAFGIDVDRVLALGSANTDKLLDESFMANAKQSIALALPSANGKRLIAYCPTFRQNMTRAVPWDTKIDWAELDSLLSSRDCIMLVKPHPLDTGTFAFLNVREFKSIFLEPQIDVDNAIAASDLLITDYSSVIFNAMLLNKPYLLYCPDIDSYQRDFYLDFPNQLPARMVTTFDELSDALKSGEQFVDMDKYDSFREQYLGACDGHSAKRIAEYIMGRRD